MPVEKPHPEVLHVFEEKFFHAGLEPGLARRVAGIYATREGLALDPASPRFVKYTLAAASHSFNTHRSMKAKSGLGTEQERTVHGRLEFGDIVEVERVKDLMKRLKGKLQPDEIVAHYNIYPDKGHPPGRMEQEILKRHEKILEALKD
jgi:hypothetical protein